MHADTIFKDRKLLIATKHSKEEVIAPILEKQFGIHGFIDKFFDSDVLGTFTGEIERQDDPLITARNKSLMAMKQNQCDIAIASEGSFGPHPQLFFLPSDDEWLVLVDKKNNIEIIVRELSLETNFGAKTINTEMELLAFAHESKFPSHGLILKKEKDNFNGMVKGILDEQELIETYHRLKDSKGRAYIETDMRAMYNPTRMKVIEKATLTLAEKMKSMCPQCHIPGFGVTEVKRGLPCNWCGSPTRSTLSFIYTCNTCNYSKEVMFPNHKTKEEPMYCEVCNP
jgi:hypothetical protein